MTEHFAIAIDGPSGAGKSSLARRAAAHFGLIYVDTGAIYRCVGLAAHRAGINTRDAQAVQTILPSLDIRMLYNEAGEQRMYLGDEDVSSDIRLPEISICASNVSAHPVVRGYLLEMQRKMAREHNVIMDGRDIGTVVLPDAELKIFPNAACWSCRERGSKRALRTSLRILSCATIRIRIVRKRRCARRRTPYCSIRPNSALTRALCFFAKSSGKGWV